MKKILIFASLLCTILLFDSCKKDEEPVVPKVTFEADVNPILKANCAPCHVANSGANFEARKKIVDNYTVSKEIATFIADRVQRDPSAAGFMPRGRAKLADTDIAKIKQWIADGLLEK